MSFEELQARFAPVLEEFLNSESIVRIRNSQVTAEEYRSYLKQVYYCVRENPQLQALATVYFRGGRRDVVKGFFDHAVSEVGHDQLALNDYVTLGGDPTDVPYKNPLPATTALTAFAFHQIYNQNPVGYLGYLYFLEFMPTGAGEEIKTGLLGAQIPPESMTFLQDHIEIDQAHNRLMVYYAKQLVLSEADVDAVDYAMRTTGYLYTELVERAFADAHAPVDTGWNWEELNADGRRPSDVARKVA
ncbi:MAG: iron-containing redox enzyme family protein [Pseudomonadota bacterium]